MAKGNILIIDNQEIIREYLKSILVKHGFHAIGVDATNGDLSEIEKVLKKNKIDVILSDILLPNVEDGRSIFNYLKNNYNDIPVIMLSVLENTQLIISFLKEGAFSYIVKNVFDEEINVNLLITTLHNAIEKRNLIKEKEVLEEQLNQSEFLAGLGTITSGIAHDIKNTLTAIKGLQKTILRTLSKLDEKDKSRDISKKIISPEDVNVITDRVLMSIECVDKINQLVNELAYNIIEKKPVDISRIIEKVITELVIEFNLDNIRITGKMKPDIKIMARTIDLQQIFYNILKNSVEAIGDRKGKIEINVYERKKNIIIEIIDNGKGIAKDILPNIFSPFYTTKDGKLQMRGFGLSLVSRKVKSYNGIINIHSSIGNSPNTNLTKFTIKFPKEN